MMSSLCSVPMERRMVLGLMPLVGQLFFRQLAVGRGGRMDHQTLDVSHVGQQRKDMQVVNEFVSLGQRRL